MEKKLKTELNTLENNKANETLRLNQTMSKNKGMKKEIDTLRKEIKGT